MSVWGGQEIYLRGSHPSWHKGGLRRKDIHAKELLKGLAAKPDNLRSASRTSMVEGEKQL